MPRPFLWLVCFALTLGAFPSLAQEVPPRIGPDFQVNTSTLGTQEAPDVASFPDGAFVTVWIDFGQVAGPTLIKARVFDASGGPETGEIEIASEPNLSSWDSPQVATLPGGEFVVIWETTTGIGGRRFDRSGQPLGAVFPVSLSTPQRDRDAHVAADAAGNFAVVWTVEAFQADHVLARRFNAAGHPLGDPVQVNQVEAGYRDHPRVAINAAGSLLVTWADARRSNNYDIWTRRFDGPSGAWGSEVRAHGDFAEWQLGATPVLYPEGDGAVVFIDSRDWSVLGQRIDASGQRAGDSVRVGGHSIPEFELADVALDAAGNALVVWGQASASEPRVYGRLFDRSWTPSGEDFPISPSSPVQDFQPSVAADPRGGFVVAWTNGDRRFNYYFPIPLPPPEDGRDGSSFGVFAQRLGSTECGLGSETLCLQDGRFRVRVIWETADASGVARAVPRSADTGFFWFFGPNNLELIVKILDGRIHNGHFWVFTGALSNVGYQVAVTDTLTQETKFYTNPRGRLESRADTAAFRDPEEADPGTAKSVATLAPLPPLITAPLSPQPPCADQFSLCLGGRFSVGIQWTDPRTGLSGRGHAVPLTGDTGAFWFFGESNLEMMVKILDGGSHNGHFWFFFGAVTDVEYTLTVSDNSTWQSKTYHNDPYQLTSRADTSVFLSEDQP